MTTTDDLARPAMRVFSFMLLGAAGCGPLLAQEPTLEQRLQRLELENRDLRTTVDGLLADAQERTLSGSAASPLSVGGYGEFLFTQLSGTTDEADALRAVVYLGYTFDSRWSLATEIEVEHANTDKNGEASLEMASLDYRACDDLEVRGGLMLVPMGIYNERHEPTAFLPTQRPETERRIIPSTWREIGAGIRGRCGVIEYQAYGFTALDGGGFSESGLRDGRQQGSKAAADDWAGVFALHSHVCNDLAVGGSAYYGMTGQDNFLGTMRIPDLPTAIAEAHAEWSSGPCSVRALYASAWVGDAGMFSAATGTALARRLEGYYVELGFDLTSVLCPESTARLSPFFRYERIDTQACMPAGITADPRQDDEIYTIGVNFKPIDKIVLKIDYAAWDHDFDRLTIGMGYAF